MFKDYYAIFEIEQSASFEEIKNAFKKQALKWHPDRNSSTNAHERMQEINEAYLILKDVQARERYDIEYQKFNSYRKQQGQERHRQKDYEHFDYNVQDDVLNKWMSNAKKQAVDLAKQTIEDFRGMTTVGIKAAAKSAGQQFVNQIIVGIIFLFIFAISKSCNN